MRIRYPITFIIRDRILYILPFCFCVALNQLFLIGIFRLEAEDQSLVISLRLSRSTPCGYTHSCFSDWQPRRLAAFDREISRFRPFTCFRSLSLCFPRQSGTNLLKHRLALTVFSDRERADHDSCYATLHSHRDRASQVQALCSSGLAPILCIQRRGVSGCSHLGSHRHASAISLERIVILLQPFLLRYQGCQS